MALSSPASTRTPTSTTSQSSTCRDGCSPQPRSRVALTATAGWHRTELIQELRRAFPGSRLIMIELGSDVDSDDLLELGVSGFFHRSHVKQVSQIIAAVRAAASDLLVVPAAIYPAATRRPRTLRLLMDLFGLTRREAEVLDLVAAGLSTKEIAYRTHYAPQTVKNTLGVVFQKLDVHRREDAAQLARRVLE